MSTFRSIVATVCCIVIVARGVTAEEEHPTATSSSSRAPVVVAHVHDSPILEAQIDRLLAQRSWDPTSTDARRAALDVVIDQRLALFELRRLIEGSTDKEIEQALSAWRARLTDRGQSEADFCNATGMTMEVVRHEISWQVNWKWYLNKHLTVTNLQEYFNDHLRDFDGTQLRVSQIQWNLENGETHVAGDATRLESLRRKAKDVRDEIEQGSITFAEAARRYSESPSAEKGGQLGWISRDGPMHEQFTRVAFLLEPGQVTTEPVLTPFGVHLILCEEVRPGERTFAQTQGTVRMAAKQFLFKRLARRSQGAVRFAGH